MKNPIKYILEEASNKPLKTINLTTGIKVVHLRDASISVLKRKI
jgi:hypothetical protein